MILFLILSLELLPGTDQDLETTLRNVSFVNLILSLIISKQRVLSSMPLYVQRKHHS
jgi:hypothetical protein